VSRRSRAEGRGHSARSRTPAQASQAQILRFHIRLPHRKVAEAEGLRRVDSAPTDETRPVVRWINCPTTPIAGCWPLAMTSSGVRFSRRRGSSRNGLRKQSSMRLATATAVKPSCRSRWRRGCQPYSRLRKRDGHARTHPRPQRRHRGRGAPRRRNPFSGDRIDPRAPAGTSRRRYPAATDPTAASTNANPPVLRALAFRIPADANACAPVTRTRSRTASWCVPGAPRRPLRRLRAHLHGR
jgi:hypothetical protein